MPPRSSRPARVFSALQLTVGLLLCGVGLGGAPAPVGADVLTPKSGKKVLGAIVTETGGELVFNIYWSRNPGVTNPEHLVRLPAGKVKKVERRPHPDVEVFRRLKAARKDDAAALVAIGEYAKENKRKAHARMCFALALAQDGDHKAALKGIGGRAKWDAVRKGNPALDPQLQTLIERYVQEEDTTERVKLQRALKERHFKARPVDLERYRRSAGQPKGYQRDRPISYRSDVRPGAVYTLSVPEAYTPTRTWPLIIGLHGGGPGGKNGDEVVGSGASAMNFYQRHAMQRGVIVACPTAIVAGWGNKVNEEYVRDLLTELRLLYNVDIDRIYLTGHSMGGFGTWALGPRLAEELAAISPMAGGGAGGIGRLESTRTPIFIYHADDDRVVGPSSDRAAAKQLLGSDLDFVYTELPKQGHGFPASVQVELFDFFEPRRRHDKGYKECWPRSSLHAKPTKEEIKYLGDPLASMKGEPADLKRWLEQLRLGGGRGLAAAGLIAEHAPEGAPAAVAKVLANGQAPHDARAYAARALGLLGGSEGFRALRKAVALPATKKQGKVARACAAALVAGKDTEALPALGKALEAWTAYYERKVTGQEMRYSDWRRSTNVLAELAAAWAALASAEASAGVLERTLVARVFQPQHAVQTSSRVPQDPSATRQAMAAAVARAYEHTNADSDRWDGLLSALENDPKAKSSAESLRPAGGR